MFHLMFVGLAAGLVTAAPMESSAPCPCISSWGETASGTSDAYGGAGGAQPANYMASSEVATATSGAYEAAWGAQATNYMASSEVPTATASGAYGAAWGTQTTNYEWGASTASCGAPATSTAGGATHTVIVAPTQGILRYVPFVVNASVGDTINFMWNANNHTVTKSSQLAICNKTMDAPFTSGEQNKSFIFQQTVNDINSTYFYCGTPGHCPKGMFGIINPPNAAMGSNTTLSSMMPAMAANSSSMAAMWQYTKMMTQNNTMVANWGGSIDMSGVPQWAQQYIAENVMYTRTFLAANPEALSQDGSVSLANAGSMKVPVDITAVQNGNASGSSGSSPAASSGAGSSGSGNNPYPTMTNGARQLGFSSIVSAFTAAVTLVFML